MSCKIRVSFAYLMQDSRVAYYGEFACDTTQFHAKDKVLTNKTIVSTHKSISNLVPFVVLASACLLQSYYRYDQRGQR